MRPLLHVLSVALVLPVVALASAFIILGRAIATGSLLGILDQLLTDALWIFPWGLLATFAVLIIITLGGLFSRTRWLAGLCVAILGVGGTATVMVLTAAHSRLSLGDLPILVPGVIASCIGAWFAWNDRRHDGFTPVG